MKTSALTLVLSLLAPSLAIAQSYPRQLKVDGMDCLEQPGRTGLEIWCRRDDGPPFRLDRDIVEDEKPRPTVFSTATGWAPSPHGSAVMAARHDRTGGYFMGGVGLGMLLGPIGWAIAGINASNSAVIVPKGDPRWNQQQQTQFALSYTSEVRRGRTTSALLGGMTGTVIFTTVVLLIASGGD